MGLAPSLGGHSCLINRDPNGEAWRNENTGGYQFYTPTRELSGLHSHAGKSRAAVTHSQSFSRIRGRLLIGPDQIPTGLGPSRRRARCSLERAAREARGSLEAASGARVGRGGGSDRRCPP